MLRAINHDVASRAARGFKFEAELLFESCENHGRRSHIRRRFTHRTDWTAAEDALSDSFVETECQVDVERATDSGFVHDVTVEDARQGLVGESIQRNSAESD